MNVTAISGTRRAIKELVDGTIRVQIDVDPAFRKAFFDLLPDIDMPVAIAPLRTDTPPAGGRAVRALGGEGGTAPVESPSGGENTSGDAAVGVEAAGANTGHGHSQPRAAGRTLAQHLHVSGYFRARPLWLALHNAGLYSVQAHKRHLESSPCAGPTFIPGHVCEGDVCAHHCNSASIADAGKALQPEAPHKPPHWYAIPACVRFHTWAHSSTGALREDKARMLEHAVALMSDQAKAFTKDYLGVESLSGITLEALHAFEAEVGLPLTNWNERG